jgi:Spy/CpxP family protein refolding chaperone
MMTRERPKYVEIMKKVNDEFIPKLKELLTAEQYQRFQQIHFQNRFNINGPRTLLEPEVASELKLTDDQKKELDTLNGEFRRSGPYSAAFRGIPGTLSPENTKKHGEEYRTKAIELLTAEQKEALNKLEGNEFDLSGLVFRSTLPPPRNGNVAAGPAIAQQKSEGTRDVGTLQSPNIVNMAVVEAVQKDLGVSDEVARKLTLLRDEYRAAAQKEYQDAGINPRDFPNSLTAEQQRKYIEIGRRLNNEFFPKAKELLTANQNKRFQQIQFQSRLRGLSAMALLAPEVASELNLTDDQKRKLNALRNEFIPKQNALMTVVGGKKGSGDREGLAKLREEYATKAMEVLTAEQRETMNKLKGNEFDLSKFVPPWN